MTRTIAFRRHGMSPELVGMTATVEFFGQAAAGTITRVVLDGNPAGPWVEVTLDDDDPPPTRPLQP